MAYDAGTVSAEAACVRQDFRRGERLVVLMGGVSLGIIAGLGVALALGRTGAWPLILGAPIYLAALYFAMATVHDALERRAVGCAAAAGMVAASLLAWPALALIFPISTLTFWAAPMAALGSMVLLASCWSGAPRAVYRLSGEALCLSAIVGYVGITHLMG